MEHRTCDRIHTSKDLHELLMNGPEFFSHVELVNYFGEKMGHGKIYLGNPVLNAKRICSEQTDMYHQRVSNACNEACPSPNRRLFGRHSIRVDDVSKERVSEVSIRLLAGPLHSEEADGDDLKMFVIHGVSHLSFQLAIGRQSPTIFLPLTRQQIHMQSVQGNTTRSHVSSAEVCKRVRCFTFRSCPPLRLVGVVSVVSVSV